jgi:hypothetical protein
MNQETHLTTKISKNLICYLFEFLTLEEKIHKMQINRVFFKALNDQKIYKEIKIFNKELSKYKGANLGILLDNNARSFTKIKDSFELNIDENLLASWVGIWLNKHYLKGK